MKQYMYHCSNCKTTETIKLGPLSLARCRCKACGQKMLSSGMTPNQWDSLTKEEQVRVYELPAAELCENKRFFNLILVALCVILCAATWLAPMLGTFEAKPSVLLACAIVYLVMYDIDCAAKFRARAEAVMAKVRKTAQPDTTDKPLK